MERKFVESFSMAKTSAVELSNFLRDRGKNFDRKNFTPLSKDSMRACNDMNRLVLWVCVKC